jgi:hypothetical protein
MVDEEETEREDTEPPNTGDETDDPIMDGLVYPDCLEIPEETED